MSDSPARAQLMARIAGPLLSASIRAGAARDGNPETLAQAFSTAINRVVPIAQILVDALKPQSEAEHTAINALAAPVAAVLIAHNPELALDGDLGRLLKPSLNVLASFSDRESNMAPLSQMTDALPRGIVAMAPIVGCLSRYAFGKSPAKRLTDALDVFTRAQNDLLSSLPRGMTEDPALRIAIQESGALLFAGHFEATLAEPESDDADAQFKTLLSQWSQSLSLLNVLIQHAAFDEDGAAAKPAKRKAAPKAESNVTPLAARKKDDEAEEGEGETAGGGSSGGGVKPGYNPMSFFTKKGV